MKKDKTRSKNMIIVNHLCEDSGASNLEKRGLSRKGSFRYHFSA